MINSERKKFTWKSIGEQMRVQPDSEYEFCQGWSWYLRVSSPTNYLLPLRHFKCLIATRQFLIESHHILYEATYLEIYSSKYGNKISISYFFEQIKSFHWLVNGCILRKNEPLQYLRKITEFTFEDALGFQWENVEYATLE